VATTKTAAGLRPVKSLQIASGLRPDEKLANLTACRRLQTLQYAAGQRPVNSLQIAACNSAGLRPVIKLAILQLTQVSLSPEQSTLAIAATRSQTGWEGFQNKMFVGVGVGGGHFFCIEDTLLSKT
jgi:hypothetical protein